MLELLAGKNFDVTENEGSVVKPVEVDREMPKMQGIWFDSGHEEFLTPLDESNDPSEELNDEGDDSVAPPRKRNKSAEDDTVVTKREEAKKSRVKHANRPKLFEALEKEFRLQCKTSDSDLLGGDLDPSSVDVLVLGAPKSLFTQDEIDGIVEFVNKGGGLLVANSYNSLFEQERQVYEQEQDLLESEEKFSTNKLMEQFGLRFKRLLSYPPDDISRFEPHYISADVNKVFLRDPAYIEVLPEMPKEELGQPQVIARLPETHEVFAAGVDVGHGRVVAIADYAMFEDDYLDYGNHRRLVLNIFRWLMAKNTIDCVDTSIAPDVVKGETSTFSITLKNCQKDRLEYVSCLLEASSGVGIEAPTQEVRSIGPFNQTQLQWKVTPHQLGVHQLRLTIEVSDRETLFFDVAAEFECLLDGEIELVVVDADGIIKDGVEVGQPFEVRAVLRRTIAVQDSEVQVRLRSDSNKIHLESMEAGLGNRWRVSASDAGIVPITVQVGKSDRKLQPYLLQVTASLQNQIDKLEQETLQPLLAQLQYQVSLISERFNSEEIRKIPCKINTPEDQLRFLNSPAAVEQKLEALKVARLEQRANLPLVEYLMNHLAPTFSPTHGCCIPYDANLAKALSDRNPRLAESISQNLLISAGDEGRLSQNLAALVLHEKYGHGFFFNHTKLGQQLAILYRHGMTRNANVKNLKAPYPRSLYLKYREPLRALWDSSVIVNEGFAAWLEVTVLSQMGGVMAESAHRRRTFLFDDNGITARAKKSKYFEIFPPFRSSRYREGYESLYRIQTALGTDGTSYAMAAFLKATDIDLGITECGGQVQFALDPRAFERAMLEDSADDARADRRLSAIEDLLKDSAEKLRSEQKTLESFQRFVGCDDLVNILIQHKLTW